MNILFLMKYFEVGGQEVVTSVLASKFIELNHSVSIVSFFKPSETMLKRLDKNISVFTLDGFNSSKKNIVTLNRILKDREIDLVINQWGLPYIPARVLKKASKGLNIKVVAVYHNSPNINARIIDAKIEYAKSKYVFSKLILRLKISLFAIITSYSMRYVYNQSDYFMVLSLSFVDKFKSFTRIKNPTKLLVQTNPVTVASQGFEFNFMKKRKEIIYVGRIDYNQKRVYRVIKTWALLENNFPDWSLTILGDGIELNNIKKLTNDLKLQNVSFKGFQNPIEYYKRASVLILTSEYEGFPLVLAECMSFGVIPCVYGSYSAAYDIIDNCIDGFVIPYNKGGFIPAKMAEQLSLIMNDQNLCNRMANNAIKKAEKYSLSTIVNNWENLFNSLAKRNDTSHENCTYIEC